MLMALLGTMHLWASEKPVISTSDQEVWYLIRFMNGGNALTAAGQGQNIKTASTTGADDQFWKIEGSEAEGYVFTNKQGLTLYCAGGEKNEMIKAASSPDGTTKFSIVATAHAASAGGWEIQPLGNSSVSMNLWGGPSENRGVGLWDKGDVNNAVTFTEETAYKNAGAISIVPYPQDIKVTNAAPLDFATIETIVVPNDEVKAHATAFATQWESVSGKTLAVTDAPAGKAVTLKIDEAVPFEGYTLTTTADGVTITASSTPGFFYALQTLKQLLPRAFFAGTLQTNVAWTLPCVEIVDKPVVGHRGFMMDVARHFFTKEEVKRVLDIMALYKMNRFHWHLTDDQGWRVEIPEYPLLTEVGAVRSGSFTSPGDGTKFFDDTEYGRGMYFTLDDLREIVAYAKALHIEILPEIDMPGHMVAAITAYPEFSCDPTKQYSVRLDSGISKDVLNIGDDRVIDFLKCVLDHMADVFPYPYVHIGGDECPTDQWTTNAACLQRVKDEGLAGVHELQSWLVEELGVYVKEKHGKDLVVWDELLNHWSSDNTVQPVIMAWNSINKSRDAANKGFKSIVVPYQNLYIDFMQVPANKALVDEPYYGGWSDNHVNTLENVYALNPLGALSGKEEYCMGVQANLWAETLNDFGELQYQLLPRMLALAEIGWLENGKKSWDSFYRRLQSQDEILDALGYIYAKHYIVSATLSPEEELLQEAAAMLADSQPGRAGYVPQAVHDALQTAYDAALASPDDASVVTSLRDALQAYKAAEVVQPEEGKYYQIVSASTYYKKQFAGSTMYQNGRNVRFHYTPQVEPEELWTFVPVQGKEQAYHLQNLSTEQCLQMPGYNTAVTMGSDAPEVLRIDKATIPTGNYTYLPGVVTLSAYEGYSAEVTGKVKRLSAQTSGLVYAKDDAALCYSGTWMLVEVDDFTAQLQGLVEKCERILRTAQPGQIGEPTENAVAFLTSDVLQPARQLLSEGRSIERSDYEKYLALYKQYLAMPHTSVLDGISEEHYYLIQNAHFTDYYACCTSVIVQPKKLDKSNVGMFWRFVKNDDGTVAIINKRNERAAYISEVKEGNSIYANYKGSGHAAWLLEELTTDQNVAGIAIVEASGTYSWYTNPSAFQNIVLKPKDWGASIWNLIQSDAIPTGIETIARDASDATFYDLSGRRVKDVTKGIYITKDGRKLLK